MPVWAYEPKLDGFRVYSGIPGTRPFSCSIDAPEIVLDGCTRITPRGRDPPMSGGQPVEPAWQPLSLRRIAYTGRNPNFADGTQSRFQEVTVNVSRSN